MLKKGKWYFENKIDLTTFLTLNDTQVITLILNTCQQLNICSIQKSVDKTLTNLYMHNYQ